jgi:tetratricopeptide (TPR) repeat protein
LGLSGLPILSTLAHIHQQLAARDVEAAEEALIAAHGQADAFDYEMACADLYMTKCQFDLAVARLNNARRMRALDARVWYALGVCFYHLGQFDEQIAAQRQAVKLNPMAAKAVMRLAAGHLLLGEYAEALALYERAVNIDPEDAELWCGYGTMLQVWGDDAQAVRVYRGALDLNPAFPEAETGLGFALLKNGQWDEGWKRFEGRWKLRPFGAAWDYRPPPVWSGESAELMGRRVLLRCEQGHGDTIQFCRYIPRVQELAYKVWLVGRPSMRRLLAPLEVTFVDEGADWPEHDVMIGLMSLAGVFGTTTENCPPPATLHVEPRAQRARVGVCWHGGSRSNEPLAHADDVRRSIPWEAFAPIAAVTPCVSLQEEDLGGGDWLDTAQVIAGLDLVITVDTAVAHLAATLGVETWMLARRGGCWRWLEHGETTVWYPSMKIYRQPVLSEWGPVIERVVADLKELVDAHEL